MKIDEVRNCVRARLEQELGNRVGFELSEAAQIMRLSKKSLYNLKIGFRCSGKRLVGIEDILSLLDKVNGGE